ncbi:hypothetical protein STEG23_020161 [Scotinomys teguina]
MVEINSNPLHHCLFKPLKDIRSETWKKLEEKLENKFQYGFKNFLNRASFIHKIRTVFEEAFYYISHAGLQLLSSQSTVMHKDTLGELFLNLFVAPSVLPATDIMPRGQKSKLRAREKRCEVRAQKALEEQDSPSPISEHPHPSIPDAGKPTPPNMLQGAHHTISDTTSAQNQDEKSSDDSFDIVAWNKNPKNYKGFLLLQFLIEKYQKKEVFTKADMLKAVNKTSKNDFREILKRVSKHMELAFGVDLREVDPIRHCYALFNKLEYTFDDVKSEENMPNTALLMMVLGVIFTKNNCASEKDIWDMLNMIGVYANRKHVMYGDSKKVITQDFVRLKYLASRKVPNSNPPSFEFTWGPRAQAEISKMKILEFWAKLHDTTPDSYEALYEIAVQDEDERTQAMSAARAGTAAMARSHSKASSSSSSHAK